MWTKTKAGLRLKGLKQGRFLICRDCSKAQLHFCIWPKCTLSVVGWACVTYTPVLTVRKGNWYSGRSERQFCTMNFEMCWVICLIFDSRWTVYSHVNPKFDYMPAVQVVRLSCGSPKTVNVSFYEMIFFFFLLKRRQLCIVWISQREWPK